MLASPAIVTLDDTRAATATVTLMTMARALSPPLPSPQSRLPILLWLCVVACLAFLVAFFLCYAFHHAPREQYDFAATASLLVVSLSAYACGGGCGRRQQSITLFSLMLNPAGVIGGASSAGTVTLSAALPSGRKPVERTWIVEPPTGCVVWPLPCATWASVRPGVATNNDTTGSECRMFFKVSSGGRRTCGSSPASNCDPAKPDYRRPRV